MKFRNKGSGEEIEAVQWTGSNNTEIESFIGFKAGLEVDSLAKTLSVTVPPDRTLWLNECDWLTKVEGVGFSICDQDDMKSSWEQV